MPVESDLVNLHTAHIALWLKLFSYDDHSKLDRGSTGCKGSLVRCWAGLAAEQLKSKKLSSQCLLGDVAFPYVTPNASF